MKLVSAQEAGLPDYATCYCKYLGLLPDGRVCGVHRLLYHWTLLVDLNPIGYEDRYCYETEAGALSALLEWAGDGEPKGWHRHPTSGRRRDPVRGKEWVAT